MKILKDLKHKKDVQLSDVIENFERLIEMANYFTNETDPTIGKLYINYPMMESYRDCDSFFDDAYSTRTISIYEMKKY